MLDWLSLRLICINPMSPTLASDAYLDSLLAQRRPRILAANACLLQQGETQRTLFYLAKGIIRAVNISAAGTERVKEFYFPGECCFLYLSWLSGHPAGYRLETLTDCVCYDIPLSCLDTPQGMALAGQLLRQQLVYKEKKEEMLLLNNPEQRYHYVLTHFPEWSAHLTLRDLASYIGITPVSLSRIRARINKG